MKFAFLILGLVAIITACNITEGPSVKIKGRTFSVEVANTEDQRRLGLMHRETLPDNGGMLFVYPSDRQLSVWMKNVMIPLDVLFLNTDGIVIDKATLEPCKNSPCEAFNSTSPGQYFLEINKGKIEELNINVGDKVEINLK
tara:strand:- start:295 stop:720 length:426 start_codon:yes stop_codon:yes gene_type:complete